MDTLVPLTPFQRIWSIRLEESKIFTRVLDNICLIPLFQELMFFVLPFPDYKVKVKLLSHVRLFVTPWTVAYQVPPSMGFSRQEYWSGLPPSPGDLPDPRIEPRSPTL